MTEERSSIERPGPQINRWKRLSPTNQALMPHDSRGAGCAFAGRLGAWESGPPHVCFRPRSSGVGEGPARRGVDLPAVRHAFQFVFAPVGKGEARASNQVTYGARHEYFAGPGQRGDASAEVSGDAADVVAAQFDLAGVQPSAKSLVPIRVRRPLSRVHTTPPGPGHRIARAHRHLWTSPWCPDNDRSRVRRVGRGDPGAASTRRRRASKRERLSRRCRYTTRSPAHGP
jgi:hypothetical protein